MPKFGRSLSAREKSWFEGDRCGRSSNFHAAEIMPRSHWAFRPGRSWPSRPDRHNFRIGGDPTGTLNCGGEYNLTGDYFWWQNWKADKRKLTPLRPFSQALAYFSIPFREATLFRFFLWLITLLRCAEWRSMSLGFAQRCHASDLGQGALADPEFIDECGTY